MKKMKMSVWGLPLALLAVGGWTAVVARAGDSPAIKLGLTGLPSPVLLEGDEHFGYRDPAAIYHDGMFYREPNAL